MQRGTLKDVQLQLRIQLWDAIYFTRSLYGKRCGSLRAFFSAVDQDGNGIVGHDELREALVRLDVGTTLPQLEALLRSMDSDSDGTVCFNEFASWMRGEEPNKEAPDDFVSSSESDEEDEQQMEPLGSESQIPGHGNTSCPEPKIQRAEWMQWAPDLIHDDE